MSDAPPKDTPVAVVLVNGPYYQLSLVGEDGLMLNIGGHVIVKPAQDWFDLAFWKDSILKKDEK